MWQLSSCWVWVSYLFNQEVIVLIRLMGPEYGLACVSCKSVGFQSGVDIRTVVLVFRRRIRLGMVDVWHWRNWGDEACCCHRDSQRVSNWSAWICILRAAESWWGSSVWLSMDSSASGEGMHGICMFLRLLSHASLYNLPIASLACCAGFGGSRTLVIFGFLVSRTVFLSRGYCHPLKAPEDSWYPRSVLCDLQWQCPDQWQLVAAVELTSGWGTVLCQGCLLGPGEVESENKAPCHCLEVSVPQRLCRVWLSCRAMALNLLKML